MRYATIELDLKRDYLPDVWEVIEDKIAEALGELKLEGELTNSVTGNSVQIKRKKDGKRKIHETIGSLESE